MYFKN